jgi:protein neuralized
MSNDRCVASRADTEFCHGYVFTSRPMQLGERLVIQVLATEPMYVGSLAFGLTSCDPASLQAADLPDDSDQLLDRHEYWVVSKDVAGGPQRGDELAFCVAPSGEVTCSKNGAAPFTLMHVDQSLQLWAFVDVYGTTQKVRVLGSTAAPRPRNSTPPLRVAMPLGAVSPTSPPRFCVPAGSDVAHASAELVQFQPAMGGGTVLVVNLPPAHSNYLNQQNQQNQHLPAMAAHDQPASSGTLLSTYSHTYIEVSPAEVGQVVSLFLNGIIEKWTNRNHSH